MAAPALPAGEAAPRLRPDRAAATARRARGAAACGRAETGERAPEEAAGAPPTRGGLHFSPAVKTKLKELCAEELEKKPLAKAVAAAWAVTLLATLPEGEARRAICTETRMRNYFDNVRREKGWLRLSAAPWGRAAGDAAAAAGRGGERKRAEFVEPEDAETAKARWAEGEVEKSTAASAAAAAAAAVAADWLTLRARSSAYADGSKLAVAATRSDAADISLLLALREGGLFHSIEADASGPSQLRLKAGISLVQQRVENGHNAQSTSPLCPLPRIVHLPRNHRVESGD